MTRRWPMADGSRSVARNLQAPDETALRRQRPEGGRRLTSAGGVSATGSSPNAIIGGDDSARVVAPASFRSLLAPEVASYQLPVVSWCRQRRGFTLTELLIVIALIVLLLVLAVPTFNLLTGARSVDAAQNQLSALLGRARQEAISARQGEEVAGVMFLVDPRTDGVAMALVAGPKQSPVPLHIIADTDYVPLPKGIDVQMIRDGAERYRGYNNATGTVPRYGGVILFDSRGQLLIESYTFPSAGQLVDLLGAPPPGAVQSHLGVVLFESAPLLEQFNPNARLDGQTNETTKESWITENATHLLVNRYNGTLIRGE